MLTPSEQQRYTRQLMLSEIGTTGQLRLKNAKVLVIGAGGLGCAILQSLVAVGVGEIGIIDNDVVSLSNLQRQILYTVDDIGLPKAEIAKNRLSRLNPEVSITSFYQALEQNNVYQWLAPYDIIIDACDNMATRYLIDDACLQLNKCWVHGAVSNFVGQVSVFNYQGCGSYHHLYPQPQAENPLTENSPIAVLAVSPALIGTLQANEVIKIICGLQGVLAGKLLTYDLRTLSQRILSYRKE